MPAVLATFSLFVPVEIRADIGALLAAGLTGEQRFQIRQPNMITPAIGADFYGMGALVVRAVDQETANASGAHLCEGDLLLAGDLGHTPLKRGPESLSNRPIVCARSASEPLPIAGVEEFQTGIEFLLD